MKFLLPDQKQAEMPAAIISKNTVVPYWNHNAAAPSTTNVPSPAAHQAIVVATPLCGRASVIMFCRVEIG